LPVYILNNLAALLVNGPGDEENVGVFRVARIEDAQPFQVEQRGKTSQGFDVAAVAA
jgi:hypothetical protein